MTKHKKAAEMPKNALDRFSTKRRRGRPPKVSASAIKGRADNYRGFLRNVWDRLSPRLLEAQTEEDVSRACEDAIPNAREFTPRAQLIFSLVKDPKFPKRPQARINFLADSLASLGLVSPRRSRDICAEERARAKRAHHIVRYEFYIECSCGYTGHSHDHACPNCGAAILFPLGLGSLMS